MFRLDFIFSSSAFSSGFKLTAKSGGSVNEFNIQPFRPLWMTNEILADMIKSKSQ